MSIIVLLSSVVFWMDRESLGSRMDISFIGLLTIVAFQGIATEGLPKISYFILMDGVIYGAHAMMAACIVGNLWVDRGSTGAARRPPWTASIGTLAGRSPSDSSR